jgi:hypothetical protein
VRDHYLSYVAKPVQFATQEYGVGFTLAKRLEIAQKLFQKSLWGDKCALLLDFYRYFYQRNQVNAQQLQELLYSDTLLESIKYITSKKLVESTDWVAFFAQGTNHFLESWVHGNNELRKRKQDQYCQSDLVLSVALTIISKALPGDESVVTNLIDTLFISNLWIQEDQRISEIAFGELLSESKAKLSRGVRKESGEPLQLCMYSVQDLELTSLPVSPDWIYSMARSYYLLKEKCISVEIIAWLQTIERLEMGTNALQGMSIPLKLYNLMFTFMLYDNKDEELFRVQEISLLLKRLLIKLTEGAFDAVVVEDPKFFNFYEEFLDHFDAVSFGDKVFAMYLFVPLTMNYSADFRMSFWTKLYHQLRIIDIDEKDLPWSSIAPYIAPVETHPDLKSLYQRARLASKINQVRNPVLWNIVDAVLPKKQ